MSAQDSYAKSESLSIGRIALWYQNTTVDEHMRKKIAEEIQTVVRVGIPILQRGLIWRPHQVEMFWDSIFRGFPVGSLVLCRKVKEQTRKSDEDVTHHLLDGQQRCDAIRLGFTDPFAPNKPRDGLAPALWLDLDPTPPNDTTREFFARLTTPSHPWGYHLNDIADRISASDMREARKLAKGNQERPSPITLSPFYSKAPVPIAWLMMAEMSTVDAFCEYLTRRLEVVKSEGFKWPDKTIRFLSNDDEGKLGKLTRIMCAIAQAKNTTMVALMAPEGLLDETVRESRDGGLEIAQNHVDISNIEHLFQRLNRQGTPLNGEELAYSMIKTYWPELAAPVDEMKNRHMPASRVVALAVRVALADDKSDHLPPTVGVSQIRSLAKAKGRDHRVTDFIIGNGQGISPLARASLKVEKWLKYSSKENPKGFLPIQLTRFAMVGTPDLYLLLLWIAHRTDDNLDLKQARF